MKKIIAVVALACACAISGHAQDECGPTIDDWASIQTSDYPALIATLTAAENLCWNKYMRGPNDYELPGEKAKREKVWKEYQKQRVQRTRAEKEFDLRLARERKGPSDEPPSIVIINQLLEFCVNQASRHSGDKAAYDEWRAKVSILQDLLRALKR